jgi:Fe2+ or Zn2+ uptake regulation protein
MDEQKKRCLRYLCNEHSYRILVTLIGRELSANEISKECNIPLQTVYRILKQLENDGLIRVSRMKLDEHGHHYKIFKANITRILVMVDENGVEIRLFEEDRAERLASLWKNLREVK